MILAGSRCHGGVRACKLPEAVFPRTQNAMVPEGPRGVGGVQLTGVSSCVVETDGGRQQEEEEEESEGGADASGICFSPCGSSVWLLGLKRTHCRSRI